MRGQRELATGLFPSFPFPFLAEKGPTPPPEPQGRLWLASPLKQLFFSRKKKPRREKSTDVEEKQALWFPGGVWSLRARLAGWGGPELAVGLVSMPPPLSVKCM